MSWWKAISLPSLVQGIHLISTKVREGRRKKKAQRRAIAWDRAKEDGELVEWSRGTMVSKRDRRRFIIDYGPRALGGLVEDYRRWMREEYEGGE